LPLVILPMFGVATPAQLAGPYGNDLVFLFIGGFILANGIEHHHVHRRLAGCIIRKFGGRPRLLVGGLMAATTLVSFVVSNTATALLMMPIGLSIVRSSGMKGTPMGKAMVLGIAAACSIGGLGTPIGSTPNLLFTSEIRSKHGIDTGFFEWMQVGTPLAVVFTLVAWAILVFWLFPMPARGSASSQPENSSKPAEPVRLGEIMAGAVVALTTLAWIFREDRQVGGMHFGVNALMPDVTDGTIAIAGALAMVMLPVELKPLKMLTPWDKASRIPWDVILMFGGGMAMAYGLQKSGLDGVLATWLGGLGSVPPWAMLVMFCLVGVSLSEVASNTAAAALLLPIASAMSVSMGQHPVFLMLPVALTTSLGFMLPAATPPNALALASGEITVRDMVKAGLLFNVVGLILVIVAMYALGFRAYGISR